MVLHLGTIHLTLTAVTVHLHSGVYLAVVQCHEETGRLKHRARLEEVGKGMVTFLAILSCLAVKVKVYHRLDVTRLHLHDYRHACIGMILAQFLLQGAFCQVLETHVYGGNDIAAVHGC